MASDVSLPNSPHLGGNRRQLGRETLQGMGMSRPRYISREGGQFRFVDEAGNETPAPGFNPQDGPYVDVVIVDTNPVVSRIFFDGPYAGKGGQPPACWSDNGIAPSVNALIPQAAKCEQGVCPQLEKRPIGYNGALRTPCNPLKKLAVLAAGAPNPGLWQFTIPAASQTRWRDYANWVMRQQIPGADRRADVTDVVTRVYFDRTAKTPQVLGFRYIALISPQVAATQDEIWESGETDDFTGRDDQPIGGMPALVQAPQPQQIAAPASGTRFHASPVGQLQPAPEPDQPEGIAFGGNAQPEQAVKKGRGRPRKEAQAPAAQPTAPAQKAAPAPPPPTDSPQTFGVQQPQQPNADIVGEIEANFKTINDAFGLIK